MRLGKYRFSPRWLPTLAYLSLMVLLLSLARWQWHRAVEKQQLLDARAARQSGIPLDLGRLTPDPVKDRFRAARVEGRFVEGQQWLLDNRLYRGQAGYHVFSLFRTHRGHELLVNRGWVAVGPDRSLLPVLPLPEGEVVLTGHLDRPESVGLRLTGQPYGSIDRVVVVQYLDLAELSQAQGKDLMPLVLVLDPDAPGALQVDWSPVPTITPEKHRGYAVQWLALAIALTFIYVGVNTRRADTGESGEES